MVAPPEVAVADFMNDDAFSAPSLRPVSGEALASWLESGLSVAFQPIANIHTGQCYGHEVLLRGWAGLGLSSADEVLDAAFAAGMLAELEIAVRRQAALAARPAVTGFPVFVNFDHRAAADSARVMAATRAELGRLFPQVVSEITAAPKVEGWLDPIKAEGGMVAVDRFGDTADGTHMLIGFDPDFAKIGRAFIRGIETDARKRVVLGQLIGMAHTLGMVVIAVGVETSREFVVCRELGFDLIQGWFVQSPLEDCQAAAASYPQIDALVRDERRRRQIDQKWVVEQLDTVPAIRIDADMRDVFSRFARNSSANYIPVVDQSGRPLGILLERDLKNYAYSEFGKDLIANKALRRPLHEFMVRCPIADIATSLDQMLAVYSTVADAEGILVSEKMVYRGFLTARSIIRAMHEKTIARARDENPLTKLPGNEVITEFVTDCIAEGKGAVLAYVDFDNFKPFNDTYGFRQGDRAILMFADLCRKAAAATNWFIGHIGGDDFFIGLTGAGQAEGERIIGDLIRVFTSDAESLYDGEARERGFIIAHDREGNLKSLPLLSASAVLFVLPPGRTDVTVDGISADIAARKKEAKGAANKLALAFPAEEPAKI